MARDKDFGVGWEGPRHGTKNGATEGDSREEPRGRVVGRYDGSIEIEGEKEPRRKGCRNV